MNIIIEDYEAEYKEAVWLYKAGRSIPFIADKVKLKQKQVRKFLRAEGLLEKPRRSSAVSNFSTMNASTTVPEGDPLLTALRREHSECMK